MGKIDAYVNAAEADSPMHQAWDILVWKKES